MKLSKVQKLALDQMEDGKWYCAYTLQVSMATLEALLNKGLVERSPHQPGEMFFPRTEIKFKRVGER